LTRQTCSKPGPGWRCDLDAEHLGLCHTVPDVPRRPSALRNDPVDKPLYWRGSLTDLATDLRELLGVGDQHELAALLYPEKYMGVVLNPDAPIALLLTCPACGARHVDDLEGATRVHHTHACQECGTVWRPAVVATVGVRFLPGFGPQRTQEQR